MEPDGVRDADGRPLHHQHRHRVAGGAERIWRDILAQPSPSGDRRDGARSGPEAKSRHPRVTARFLLARLMSSLLVMVLVALLTFLLIDLAPGSYLDDLASNPQISQTTLDRIRDQYGLGEPFYRQFFRWCRRLAAGDLGAWFVYERPIRQLVAERVGNTVLLNLTALAFAWVTGFALGLAAAARRGSAVDWLVGATTTVLLSTPGIVVAIVLLASAVWLGLPIGGVSAP